MAFRDFDESRPRDAEPVEFRLGGKRFACVPRPALIDCFALADAPEPTENEAQAVRAIARFVENLLVNRRDVKRFRKVLSSRRDPIDSGTVIELGAYLFIEYAKRAGVSRPTVPPGGSSPGRHSEPSTSEDSQSAADIPAGSET